MGTAEVGRVGNLRVDIKLLTQLFPYQVECVQEVEDFNGIALLALEPGLGKTLCSLAYWQRHPEIHRAVVVCPASAQWHWEREARRHLGIRSEVLEGIYNSKKKPLLEPATRLFIIGYDVLLRRKKGSAPRTWVPFLKHLKPDLIIFDESHLLCGLSSQRTRASQVLAEGIPRRLALSGTPLTNRPADLWPTLNILRPDKWKNFYSFAHVHCNAKYNKRYASWDFRGSSNIKELHKKLRRLCLVRRRKIDVLKDLPPKAKHVIPLAISNEREYHRALYDFLGWLREKSPSKAARAARMEEVAKVGYLLRLVGEGKLKNEMEWIDNFLEGGEKLLAFAIHKKILDALEERYKGICVRVDGSVLGRNRQLAFDQFNKSKNVRLFLGNIDAAGTVWSCTSTSDVAFCELPWSPTKVEQAIDRCRGVGRGIEGRKTRAWFLVAHGTIEEKLCELLQRKNSIITSIIDGKEVKNDLNILDVLLESMEDNDGSSNPT